MKTSQSATDTSDTDLHNLSSAFTTLHPSPPTEKYLIDDEILHAANLLFHTFHKNHNITLYEESSSEDEILKKRRFSDSETSVDGDWKGKIKVKKVNKKRTFVKKEDGEGMLVSGRVCSFCSATVTPMWRHGPPSHPGEF